MEEAVVYFSFLKPVGKPNNLFVMKKEDAIKFCSRNETKGKTFMLCFTTHKKNWRNELKSFIKDDGRYNELIKELNIDIIYKK
jgi:hypothetical protein